VHSGDSKDFQRCQKWSRSSEVNPEMSIFQREGSIEVKWEAISLDNKGFSGSPEQRFHGGSRQG